MVFLNNKIHKIHVRILKLTAPSHNETKKNRKQNVSVAVVAVPAPVSQTI